MGRIGREQLAGILAWSLVAAWAAWALARLLGLETGLLIAWFAFTPYVALAAVIPIAVALFARRWLAVAAAVAVAVLLAALVLPRAFGGPSEPDGAHGPEVRVLAANVKLGRADAPALAGLVRELDVDLLAVSELTPQFAAALERAGATEQLPHRELVTGPSSQGTGLYSRWPLRAPSSRFLPGGFALAEAVVELPGSAPLVAAAVHTVPPVTDTALWAEDLEALPAAGSAGPLRVLAGDFNATLDHAAFRDVVDRGYADAAATLGDGLAPTWPADRRVPPLVGIDHVLADERIGVREFSVEDLPDSDHRPVFAELGLPASGG